MTSVLERRLRRLGAGVAAAVAASAAMVVTSPAPAQADTWAPPAALRNHLTGDCLVTDYSSRVYTHDNCRAQHWRFQWLDAYPGTAVLHNQTTNRCLMQFDWTTVISSADCDGSRAEFRWRHLQNGYLQSANTGRLLHDINNDSVALLPSAPDTARWVQYG